jgi:hypothetical protein
MKSYKLLKEDIGLSTGVGLAGIDIPLGTPPVKRRFNGYNNDVMLAHKIDNMRESLAICEDCKKYKVLKDGIMTCPTCTVKTTV